MTSVVLHFKETIYSAFVSRKSKMGKRPRCHKRVTINVLRECFQLGRVCLRAMLESQFS